jgi:hypothetical protein
MEIERKLKAIEAVYALYDGFLQTEPTACGRGCTDCCTTQVTLTTLEAYRIWENRLEAGAGGLEEGLTAVAAAPRRRPQLTANGIAALCAAGREPPEEDPHAPRGACPLLAEGLCSIYALRPFHCRCFVSRTLCRAAGCADVTEFMVSVNTVFLQTIEHLDADGCSGNLLDLLAVFAAAENRVAYTSGALRCSGNGLIANAPMEVLMVPPEHRPRMEPILERLRTIRV